MPKTVKLTYEFVRKFFEENGCEMLDSYYKNARTHINYRCHCGNISKIIFDSFRRGHRCKKCAFIETNKKQRLKFSYVYDYFKRYGCELLGKEYFGYNIKMRYKCKCENISYTTFGNFKNKRIKKCYKCSVKGRSGENHYEWVADRESFEEYKRIRDRCHKMLKYTLRKTNQIKNCRTKEMLGYSPEDLKNHIYNHSNWEKIKNRDWHLDHIFPIQAFLDCGIEDLKLINALDNLQPLLAKDNISKSDNYDVKLFNKWIKERRK